MGGFRGVVMAANEGERFAAAFLAKDWDGVRAVMDPAVDFRGVTPGRVWEAGRITNLRLMCSGPRRTGG